MKSVNKRKNLSIKILGIDPGTRNCGYAVLEKNGRHVKLIEAGLIKIKTRILQEQPSMKSRLKICFMRLILKR